MATYIKNPLIYSILSQFIPSLSSRSILVSSAMILQIMSHIYCDTNPWPLSWVLVMVPSNGTDSCEWGLNLTLWVLYPQPWSFWPPHYRCFPTQFVLKANGLPIIHIKNKIGCNQSIPAFLINPWEFAFICGFYCKGNQHLIPSKIILETQHVSQCYSFISHHCPERIIRQAC